MGKLFSLLVIVLQPALPLTHASWRFINLDGPSFGGSSNAIETYSSLSIATGLMEPSGADKGFFQKSPTLDNQFYDESYQRCFQCERCPLSHS